MTFKITIETDNPSDELLALEQKHNAGKPALESRGYEPVKPYEDRTGYEPTETDLKVMETHPEFYQFHNAGRPAVEAGSGNERCLPALPTPEATTD